VAPGWPGGCAARPGPWRQVRSSPGSP
jgi:hypothetical protein